MMGFRRSEIVTLTGLKIPLVDGVFSPNIVKSIKQGLYEQEEASQLGAIIQEGERVLEIGGGIGYISALVARDARTSAVRVFEANPRLIPVIEKLHKLNKIEGVDVVSGVLANSDINATSKFYVRNDFWASSLAREPWGYEEVIEVPNLSFSTEIETFRPSLIICDIEGGELELFMNAELKGVRKVYMEVHQPVIGRAGMKKLFEAMSARNFHYDQWHSCGAVILFSHIDR